MPAELPGDGEMNEMTPPSRHSIRNSYPRLAGSEEVPHNIESLRVSGEETFFVSLKVEGQSGVRARDPLFSKQADFFNK